MTDYYSYFESLISRLLAGELSRAGAAADVTDKIGIDEIAGGRESLLINCEWALRHAAIPRFWTSDQEFAYLQACLRGEHSFTESGRDAAILAQGAADEA